MHKCVFGIIFAALALPLALAAQTNNGFAGTWKLNVDKSKIESGGGAKAETVTIAADGKVNVEEVTNDGQTVAWSYAAVPGQEVTITGMGDNATVIETRPDDRSIELVWKIAGANEHGKGVLSDDGKVMIYTITGTNAKGEKVQSEEYFEKQ